MAELCGQSPAHSLLVIAASRMCASAVPHMQCMLQAMQSTIGASSCTASALCSVLFTPSAVCS